MNYTIKPFFTRLFGSSLVRSSGIYTFSSIINSAIPLILVPILTRKLTPADYGIVAMFQLAVSVILPFIGMNLEGSIARKYYDKDGTDFPTYIGTCILLVLCSFIVISGLSFVFINQIQRITQIPQEWLKYLFLVAICQFITSLILVIYQVSVQPVKYGIFQIAQSLVNFCLTVLLIVIINKTWQGRVEAQIITGVTFALVSLILLWKTNLIQFNIQKKDIKYALSFGVPLIPHAIGAMFFSAIDRFFLTNLIGLEQTGNYTVAFQIGAVLSLFTVAFNNAYVPWLFENLNKNDKRIKIRIVKYTYLYFLLLIVAAFLLILIFPILVMIFIGSAFKSINVYSTFIVLGFVFQGMYFMVTNYIIYAKKTYLQAAVTISVSLIKIPITYFLILWFGAIGASISYSITFFIFFVATWVLSAKVYKMPWKMIKIT